MSKLSRAIVATGSVVALTFGLGPAAAARPPALDHRELCPTGNPSFYDLDIDNPYFPLPDNVFWAYTGSDEEGKLGLRITVTDDEKSLYSGSATIVTRVVEELEWVDHNLDAVKDGNEPLIERSLNYFAQTDNGTVCYFGEHVDIYENGQIVSNEGSWQADDGRKTAPGIFMPANPQNLPIGTDWFMEVAPKVAKDRATLEDVDETVTVPAGTFQNSIEIRDCNTVERPVDCGTKFYSEDVGLIVDGPLQLKVTNIS